MGGKSLKGFDLAVSVPGLLRSVDLLRERPTLPGGLQRVGGWHTARLACRTGLVEMRAWRSDEPDEESRCPRQRR